MSDTPSEASGLPTQVRIVEVGPRDGLQNEATPLPTETKLRFIAALADAGVREIEATSFVHPKAIPQLADAADVAAGLQPRAGVTYSALVPNEKGLRRALDAGLKRLAVFTAASDTFTQKNIRMTIDESLAVFAPVVQQAREAGASVRGYLSTCFVCPYEGEIVTDRVVDLTRRMFELGVDEVAISDTIGAAGPRDVRRVIAAVLGIAPAEKLALHLHDTYGTALANVVSGLELGIATFDASAGGLGGCPYAPGAAGNLATEDLVYLLERTGIATGIDLNKLVDAAAIISDALGRELPSRNWRRLRCGGF